MSTPALGEQYVCRVMVEVVEAGVPRRMHLWKRLDGATRVAFGATETERTAEQLVSVGRDMLAQVDVPSLFKPGSRARRLIQTD